MQIKAKRYNIQIISNIDTDINIIGHSDKLKQVFINIIDNSIKYAYENSIIKVAANRKGSNIKIVMEDMGEGIPEENLKSIFQPFYRANKISSREKGSSGLGLAISKAVIDKLGGSILIESKINVGTVVIIYLQL